MFCCQHFSGPSRVSDYFRPVERGLRLDGNLERLWWKLFIHVNSDLSEISQEQLWLLDTSVSRGRQSVAGSTSAGGQDVDAASVLSRSSSGVIGDAETPSYLEVHVHTEHRVLSLLPDAEPTVPRPPDPKPVIWSVSMAVQASATDFEALPLCANLPPGDSTLGSSVPRSPPSV